MLLRFVERAAWRQEAADTAAARTGRALHRSRSWVAGVAVIAYAAVATAA
jgi:hypothetical protein